MSLTLVVTLLILGGLGGFAAGLLGVGGGVLLFPLLFYIPPLLGLESLDAKTVAAVVVSQVFFSTVVGGAAHWRSGRVHPRLTLVGGLSATAGSFLGGVGSKWVSEWFLLLLFGMVTLSAAAMMFLPGPSAEQELRPVGEVTVPVVSLSILSCLTGVVVGFLGAGNFLFVPLLIYVLKVPTRITIGSNLVIAVASTFSGFLGKLLTGQEKSKSNFLIILVGLCGGVVAFLLHSFFDTNLYSFQLSLNFWFFIGLILSIHRLLKESPLYGIKAQ